MAIWSKTTVFDSPTGTGAQAVPHGLVDGESNALTPKLAIIISIAHTTTDTGTSWGIHAFGVSDGTNQWALSGDSESGVTTSDTGHTTSDADIIYIAWDGILRWEADVTSFDSTNVNLNWSTVLGSSHKMLMITLGGDLEATVGSALTNGTAGDGETENVAHGHSAAPTALIVGATGSAASWGPAVGVRNRLTIGAVDTELAQFGMTILASENQATSQTVRIQKSDEAFPIGLFAASLLHNAKVVAMDATNFTLEWIDAPGAGKVIGWVAISGTTARVQTFSQKTTTGSYSVSVPGILPKFVMLGSINTTAETVTNHARWSFGFGAGGSDRIGISFADEHNVGTTDAGRYSSTTAIIRDVQEAAPSAPTVIDEIDLVSFEEHTVNLDQAVASGVANTVHMLVLGESISAGGGGSPGPGSGGGGFGVKGLKGFN